MIIKIVLILISIIASLYNFTFIHETIFNKDINAKMGAILTIPFAILGWILLILFLIIINYFWLINDTSENFLVVFLITNCVINISTILYLFIKK